MPYHMHLFGVIAIQDGAQVARPWFSRRLVRNVLRFFDRQRFAALWRRKQLIRSRRRRYDDMLAIYPPALADLKRRCDCGAG